MIQTWAAAFHICRVSCLPSMLVLKMCNMFYIWYDNKHIYIYIYTHSNHWYSVFCYSLSRTFSRNLAQFLGQSQTGAGPFPSFAKPTENLPPVTGRNSWTEKWRCPKMLLAQVAMGFNTKLKIVCGLFWVPHGTPWYPYHMETPHLEMCHNQHHTAMPSGTILCAPSWCLGFAIDGQLPSTAHLPSFQNTSRRWVSATIEGKPAKKTHGLSSLLLSSGNLI